MITYLLEAPLEGDQESQRSRARIEQRLNSMSAKEIEDHYSRNDLRSGLMKFTLMRPEHKLRDLARIVLGKTVDELGELNIQEVAQLFYERRMTFTLNQIANIAYRRIHEYGAMNLLEPESHEIRVMSAGKVTFLAHDEHGNVSVVVMQNQKDYFPCAVTSVKEGALCDDKVVPVILRHPNPYLMWKLWQPEGPVDQDNIGADVPQLEEAQEITFNPGTTVSNKDDRKKASVCADNVLKAYMMQNLKVRCSYGILARHFERTQDERPLFGIPDKGMRADPLAVQMDAFVAEMRGMMAQMSEFIDLPPQTSEAEKSRRTAKLQLILDSGMTFSTREAGLFMRNAPRRSDRDSYAILVHDETGEVYSFVLRYRNRRIISLEVTPAYLHSNLNEWGSSVNFCIRTPFMDATMIISPAFIVDHTGRLRA